MAPRVHVHAVSSRAARHIGKSLQFHNNATAPVDSTPLHPYKEWPAAGLAKFNLLPNAKDFPAGGISIARVRRTVESRVRDALRGGPEPVPPVYACVHVCGDMAAGSPGLCGRGYPKLMLFDNERVHYDHEQRHYYVQLHSSSRARIPLSARERVFLFAEAIVGRCEFIERGLFMSRELDEKYFLHTLRNVR